MNTCGAIGELHENLAMPGMQTVQYEFKDTPSLLDAYHCDPLTTYFTDRSQTVYKEMVAFEDESG